MSPEIFSLIIAGIGLLVSGLVALGVEGSEKTEISGLFAAGWLALIQGMGFLGLGSFGYLKYGVLMGIGFMAIGLAIISLPIAHRELQRAPDRS